MYYLIFVFFFLSGACGLVYEVVWSREFVLVFGGTTHAVTAVVVSFMGGLALGSVIGGRLVDRSKKDPILIYGVLEGLIGAFALLVPLFVDWAKPILSYSYVNLWDSPFIFNMTRFMVSAAILFPPTLCMGATLPVLLKATLLERERFGLAAGRLYALNTIGAMVGAGLAGFVILPALGNWRTIILAAAINILIFALVFAMRGRFKAKGGGTDVKTPEGEEAKWTNTALLVLFGYCLSGMAALIYQIAWTRSFTMIFGGSTYSFSIILVAYIGGLGFGGALISKWVDSIKKPLLWAGVMEFVIGLSAIAVIPLFEVVNVKMNYWVAEYGSASRAMTLLRFGVTFGLLIVPTLMMGMLLPLIARVVARERSGAGEPMGWVYASNSVGSIIGAFLAGFVLLHFFGVRPTVLFATAASLLIGVLWTLGSELPRRAATIVSSTLAGGGIVMILAMPPPDPLVINSGPYIYGAVYLSHQGPAHNLRQIMERNYILRYFREDAETTVSVLSQRIDEDLVLKINGKTDATTSLDMTTQILLAHVPLILHKDPKKVMVLGLASGVTSGSALKYDLDRLDALELSPAVLEASRFFKDASGLDYEDPRLRIIINDGRNHLALGEDKYDVIISEPSNPWQAGQGIMFTREFYEIMKNSLNPGGVALAWIDVYNMDERTLAMALRTFCSVFPSVTLWESTPMSDYLLFGSNEPLKVSCQSLAAKFENEKIRQDLARADVNPDNLLARFVMNEERIMELVGDGPLQVDDRRQFEFTMPGVAFDRDTKRLTDIAENFLSKGQDASVILVDLPEGDEGRRIREKLAKLSEGRNKYVKMRQEVGGNAEERESDVMELASFVESLGGHYPAPRASIRLCNMMINLAAQKRKKEGPSDEVIELLEKAAAYNPEDSFAPFILAGIYFDKGDLKTAREWADKSLAIHPRNYRCLELVSRIERRQGNPAKEEEFLVKAIEVWPSNPEFYVELGVCLFDQGKVPEALKAFEVALKYGDDYPIVHVKYAAALASAGRKKEAVRHFKKAIELNPNIPNRKKMEETIKEWESEQ